MRRMTFVGSDLIQILLQHQYYNNTGEEEFEEPGL
jgi:hypothetical protein